MSKFTILVDGVELGIGGITATSLEVQAEGLRFAPGPVTESSRRLALAKRLGALGLAQAELAVNVAILCDGSIELVAA